MLMDTSAMRLIDRIDDAFAKAIREIMTRFARGSLFMPPLSELSA